MSKTVILNHRFFICAPSFDIASALINLCRGEKGFKKILQLRKQI